MELVDLGYNEQLKELHAEAHSKDFELGRVVAEHKERYVVKTATAELDAEITGNLRFSAKSREDFPAVGDWVSLTICDAEFAIIHKVLPRFSMLSRQTVGHFGEIQIIATNIDYAFLVQAADRDFNLNRLERYLTICYASKITPIILLTKIDLCSEQAIAAHLNSLQQRIENTMIIAISNETQAGYEVLRQVIEKGKTYCMLGSSGVGKSTLMNQLLGKEMMRTDALSKRTLKGRHTTTHRELIILENGGILIDNPGVREVGIVDTARGLETAFDKIGYFAQRCKFKDCSHLNAAECAVLEAVETGEIDRDAYANYLKMEREKTHFETSVVERRKKDKSFGKMLKSFKKSNKDNFQ
jgi:ribosome biogenesis GTPase / thiamine phosphate phosphatase